MTRDEAIAEQERLFPRTAWISGSDHTLMMEHVPTLPEICLDLRSSCNCKADSWPTEFLEQVVAMLFARLDTWGYPEDRMDCHIRGLIQQAVWIGRAELADRARAEAETKP